MIYVSVQFSREASYTPPIQIVTYRVVEESHQGHDNNNEHKGYIVPYPLFPDPEPPIANFRPRQDALLILDPLLFGKLIVGWYRWVRWG